LTWFISGAVAAQSGKVISSDASVYLYPQSSSRVIGKLPKDSMQNVSNLPTEGFYKVKLPSGEMGWISGNDIFVNGAKASSVPERAPLQPKVQKSEVLSDDVITADPFHGDQSRIQMGYGFQNLSYGGLSDYFERTVELNYGKNFGIEYQRKISHHLSWAFRGEILWSKTGTQNVSGNKTQVLDQYALPIQLGLIYSPIYSRKFRIGIGGYGGFSPVTYIEATQQDVTTTNSAKFSSIDLVGTGSIQAVYGFGRAFGLYGEAAYHYQVTGTLPATTSLGAIPSFKINYSGFLMRFGMELRI